MQTTTETEIQAAGAALAELKAAIAADHEAEFTTQKAAEELERVHDDVGLPNPADVGRDAFFEAVRDLEPDDRDAYAVAADAYISAKREWVEAVERLTEATEALGPYWNEGTTLGQLDKAIQAGGPLPTEPAPEPTEPGLHRVSGDALARYTQRLHDDVGADSMAKLRDHYRATSDEDVVFRLLDVAAKENGCVGLDELETKLTEHDLSRVLFVIALELCSRLQHGPGREV